MTLGTLPVSITSTRTIPEHITDHLELHRVYNLGVGIVPEVTMNSAGAGVANVTALQAAATYAASVGKPVDLPGGTFYLTFSDSAGNRSIAPTADLRIIGKGQGQTVIQVGPEDPSFVYKLFDISASPNVNLTIENMTITGPAEAGNNGQNNQATKVVECTAAGTGTIRLRNVTINGEFYEAITLAGGERLLSLDNCDISAYVQAVVFFDNSGATNARFHARDCYFHDAGLSSAENNGAGVYGHLVYVHPHISVHFDNCKLNNAERFGFHHFGSPTGIAKYVRFDNCHFGSGLTTTAITSSTNSGISRTRTVFNNCTIEGGGIQARADVEFNACHMTADIVETGTTTTRVWFNGGKFEGQSMLTLTGSEIRFTGTNVSASGIPIWSTGSALCEMDSCRFGSVGNQTFSITTGTVRVRRCTAIGAWTSRLIRTRGSVTLELEDNDFTGMTSGATIEIDAATTPTIRGAGNRFASARTPATNSIKGYLSPPRGLSPTTLASGATLQPTLNHDTFHVSGTTTIDNISVGNSAEWMNLFAGKLFLIFDSTAATADGGNIRPKSTSARTANEMACFQYDPAAALWYEVA